MLPKASMRYILNWNIENAYNFRKFALYLFSFEFINFIYFVQCILHYIFGEFYDNINSCFQRFQKLLRQRIIGIVDEFEKKNATGCRASGLNSESVLIGKYNDNQSAVIDTCTLFFFLDGKEVVCWCFAYILHVSACVQKCVLVTAIRLYTTIHVLMPESSIYTHILFFLI